VDNFCLPAQELKHLKLEFYHDTRVLKTQDAIFSHCFANITTNEIVKNLRPNGKKKFSSPVEIQFNRFPCLRLKAFEIKR